MTNSSNSNPNERTIPRPQLLSLLRTALARDAARFARQSALSWLGYFPGDLPVSLFYAKSLLKTNNSKQAIQTLEKICQADPEYLEAQQLLTLTLESLNSPASQLARSALYALGGDIRPYGSLPDWSTQVRQARLEMNGSDLDTAELLVHQALLADPPTPLAAITHLHIATLHNLPVEAMRQISSHYASRWPSCVPLLLFHADALMDGGESEAGVSLLHKASILDITGEVARRMWGEDHPYRNLWPEQLSAPLDYLIPAEISAMMGWNQLAQGGTLSTPASKSSSTIAAPPPKIYAEAPAKQATAQPPEALQIAPNEELRQVQNELEKVAGRLKQNHLAQADGRFPMYVIFTTKRGLERQYGEQAALIDTEMKNLITAVRKRGSWGSILLYADDAASMARYGLKPAAPSDAWSLKLALVDLDAALSKQGQMIGAVLIVGGPEVVPFHHLPNPVDDNDTEVPSDNPYTTRDENYFIPEWPIGRLPGGAQSDAAPLLHALKAIISRQPETQTGLAWYQRLLSRFRRIVQPQEKNMRASWGYTAAIWRRASNSVFRPIGDPHALLISPPAQSIPAIAKNGKKNLQTARLGYFNLHGMQDSSDWYGQRDPADRSNAPDYPVAYRPQDVVNSGRAPHVVFSEACFGAHILGKGTEDAISLKFLCSGTRAVVGSTCTAYGSVTPPLIGADLLGHTFWKHLREGLPAGESLRRAKIQLAREMVRRQGYLDGEDQKTLISFVLYGDPLVSIHSIERQGKGVYRPAKSLEHVNVVCDRPTGIDLSGQAHSVSAPSEQTVKAVKQFVKQYLPNMHDATLCYSTEHAQCDGHDHTCPTSQLHSKGPQNFSAKRNVVTLKKQVEIPAQAASQTHYHYARLTLDNKGKIVKMAVSR